MTELERARTVVAELLEKDAFSNWLGVEVVQVKPGMATVRMTVRKEMLNGHGLCHGGVTFALADTALAFAANAHGRLATSIECSITYPAPVHQGDVLTAPVEEQALRSRLGIYSVTIENAAHRKVGLFHGIVYRADKEPHPEKSHT